MYANKLLYHYYNPPDIYATKHTNLDQDSLDSTDIISKAILKILEIILTIDHVSIIDEMVQSRSALSQTIAVWIKNIILIGFGNSLGFPTILIPSLSGIVPGETVILNDDGKSWIASINLITVPLGCLASGYITHTIGRRRTIQMLNIPFLLSWLLFYISTKEWHIYFALALTGLSGGFLEAPVVTYVAEICEPHVRGMLSTTSALSINVGVLWTFIFGTFFPWRQLALINCIIPVLAFVCLMFVPESPYWLIMKNRLDDAKKSIAWLRGWTTLDQVDAEFQHLCRHLGAQANNTQDCIQTTDLVALNTKLPIKERIKLFTQKRFIQPFLTVSFGLFLSYFGGNFNIQTYAVEIFAALKTPIDEYYATILVGLVQILGVITTMLLIRHLGKRIVSITALIGCVICFAMIAMYCHLANISSLYVNVVNSYNSTTTEMDMPFNTTKVSWLPMTCIILNAFLANAGVHLIPWILMGEIFSSNVKATATGMAASIGYIFGFTSNKCFLMLVNGITLPGVMWFYAIVSILGIVVWYYFLPETEGKSLFEIDDHYTGKCKLDNKLYRQIKIKSNGNLNNVLEDEENNKREQMETII